MIKSNNTVGERSVAHYPRYQPSFKINFSTSINTLRPKFIRRVLPLQFARIPATCVERAVYTARQFLFASRNDHFFSTTSCSSCARSPFFTVEDFQTPYVPRTLPAGSAMKERLHAARIVPSLGETPRI